MIAIQLKAYKPSVIKSSPITLHGISNGIKLTVLFNTVFDFSKIKIINNRLLRLKLMVVEIYKINRPDKKEKLFGNSFTYWDKRAYRVKNMQFFNIQGNYKKRNEIIRLLSPWGNNSFWTL